MNQRHKVESDKLFWRHQFYAQAALYSALAVLVSFSAHSAGEARAAGGALRSQGEDAPRLAHGEQAAH